MKKIFALALLLGLGMLVGCGDEGKPKTTGSAKSSTTTTTTTTKDSTTTPPVTPPTKPVDK